MYFVISEMYFYLKKRFNKKLFILQIDEGRFQSEKIVYFY